MNAKTKYHILMQGTTSKNVSETCKAFGISRTIYYKWQNAYKKHGMDGLAEKEKNRSCQTKWTSARKG
ncbi:helix-turn-helix domain-containing protein [Paenibacillus tianjinensis]|uniref:Helix-turn-helix domain-containing protein n=1 Tax=Paenibacillus tianjinensis TaxID=2810347 RepID=A0ABX7LE16_9BACL|nr:helix-turn-helix domain-containing protein [Paenibacillus tianjinensis]